jgi:hypothetical protein
MVSATWSVAGRESVLGILARWVRQRGREVSAGLAVLLRFVLVAAGLAAVTVGFWTLAHWAGWMAGGASLLLLEWVVKRR